jgi:hypothetical protein
MNQTFFDLVLLKKPPMKNLKIAILIISLAFLNCTIEEYEIINLEETTQILFSNFSENCISQIEEENIYFKTAFIEYDNQDNIVFINDFLYSNENPLFRFNMNFPEKFFSISSEINIIFCVEISDYYGNTEIIISEDRKSVLIKYERIGVHSYYQDNFDVTIHYDNLKN